MSEGGGLPGGGGHRVLSCTGGGQGAVLYRGGRVLPCTGGVGCCPVPGGQGAVLYGGGGQGAVLYRGGGSTLSVAAKMKVTRPWL